MSLPSKSAASARTTPRRASAMLTNGTVLVAILYVLLFVANVAMQSKALNISSVTNLVNNAAPLAIASAGQALIVISKGFDLSVAGVISLTNVLIAAYPVPGPFGALFALVIALLVGALVGLVNGFLVVTLRMQSIAATLGTMIITQGLALVIMDAPNGTVADWLADQLTARIFGYIPVAGLVVLAVVGLWMLFLRTDTAVGLYAIGMDESAASLSGVPTQAVRFKTFIGAGMLYGLAGFMLSAQTATGNPNAGTPFLMLTFAAVSLGGVLFSGGKGSPVGAMIGAATLMLLQKVLFSGGVSSFYTGIFQGAVLIAAIVFSGLVSQLAMRDTRA
jgi:ribose transport system permease protein